jgi:hypothetical protein
MKKILLIGFAIFICALIIPGIALANNNTDSYSSSYLREQREAVCDPNELYQNHFTLIPLSGCLAEKFRTGSFNLGDILVYIKYLTEVLILIVATASIVFIIYGGYNYLLSFVIEDKEAGQKTITNALIGLAVSIMSWIIVNTILYIISS